MGTYKILPRLSSTPSGLLSYNDQSGVLHKTTPDSATILNIITGNWIPNGLLFNLVAGVGGSATSGSVFCIPDSTKISLDGGGFIDENHLPVGFNVTSGRYTPVISAALTINTSNSFYGATSHSPAAIIDLPSASVNLINVLANFFGISWVINDGNNGEIDVSTQLITGNYSIISSSWVINNLTHPGGTFRTGDTGQITSSPSGTYDFSTVTQISIGSFIINTFTIQSPIEIQFIIPPNAPPGSNQPTTIYNPSQFTGDALVGFVTVVISDASGVYTVITGVTHDTVYVSSQTDGTTENVAIPTPGASSGFLGG